MISCDLVTSSFYKSIVKPRNLIFKYYQQEQNTLTGKRKYYILRAKHVMSIKYSQ